MTTTSEPPGACFATTNGPPATNCVISIDGCGGAKVVVDVTPGLRTSRTVTIHSSKNRTATRTARLDVVGMLNGALIMCVAFVVG